MTVIIRALQSGLAALYLRKKSLEATQVPSSTAFKHFLLHGSLALRFTCVKNDLKAKHVRLLQGRGGFCFFACKKARPDCKTLVMLILLIFLNVTATHPGFSQGKKGGEVNFLNWAQYIDPTTITQFQQQTDIHINQSFYSGSDMLQAKLMAGNAGYDVIIPALVDMKDEIHNGLLQPLDKKLLPNLKYKNPVLYKLTSQIDTDNKYAVIYQYGTTGIAINATEVKRALGNTPMPKNLWELLLTPRYLKKLKGCGVSYLDSPTQVYGIVFHYLHINPNTQKPADYEKATKFLLKLRPYLTYFDNVKYETDLASGNICIAMAYSGDTLQAKTWAKKAGDKVNLKFLSPKSGVPIWFDMLAIPKGAPHPKAAHQWINYLISAKVAAKNSNYLQQPNATLTSKPYLDPVLNTPLATPDQQTLKHSFLIHDMTPELKPLVSRLWFKVKYGA